MDYLAGDKDMWLMARDIFKKVGIEVDLKQYGAAALNDKVYNQKKFQTSWAGGGTGPDPDQLRHMFHTEGSGNPCGYSNAEVNKLLTQASQLMKPEERQPLCYKVQELVDKDCISIPIWNLVLDEVWSKDFTGGEGYSMYFADLANID